MDTQTILSAITSVGFPIVMCLIFCWYINKKDTEHKNETDKFVESINNNTLALQKLCDMFDDGYEHKQ